MTLINPDRVDQDTNSA
jgi:hypothetical protein